jgi:hypothetical protein
MDLSPKRNLVLCMVIAGHSNAEIAEALGMTLGGVEKIRRDKNFREALRSAVTDVHSRAVAELASGAIAAASRIKKIVESEKTSDYHAILAARLLFDVLESSRKWELEERLERIEQLLKVQDIDINGAHPPNSQN